MSEWITNESGVSGISFGVYYSCVVRESENVDTYEYTILNTRKDEVGKATGFLTREAAKKAAITNTQAKLVRIMQDIKYHIDNITVLLS